jgi:hypothetical protein
MSFTIVPLLFLNYYKSLGDPPRLPPLPTAIDRIRYSAHKSYYQYMVTFSGYMLDPAERFLFDVLLGLMLCALIWFSTLMTPPLSRLVLHGLSGDVFNNNEAKNIGTVMVQGWAGNGTMKITTALGTMTSTENCTAVGL